MKVGDKLRDNDPRMGNRVLTIAIVFADRVAARDSIGKLRMYRASRIHTDGKPRRGGFDLLPKEQA